MIGSPPRSEWDIAGEQKTGEPVRPGYRYVPTRFTMTYEQVSIQSLYEADAKKPGRPLKFDLATASAIKAAYWSGKRTIVQLAREHGCTKVTISRLVHGKTMWYA